VAIKYAPNEIILIKFGGGGDGCSGSKSDNIAVISKRRALSAVRSHLYTTGAVSSTAAASNFLTLLG
jgi:hypothetical protein